MNKKTKMKFYKDVNSVITRIDGKAILNTLRSVDCPTSSQRAVGIEKKNANKTKNDGIKLM